MTLLHLLVVGWLPGAAIFRLPYGDRDARALLEAEERLFWAVVISAALSVSLVLGLAAVGRYSFERLLIADLAIAAIAAAAGRFRLGYRGTAKRVTFGAILPLALVLLGVWRFFPPSEYIIGGKDPGTYINEGVQIAQRGTFVYRDPVVAEVPPFARDLFFPSHLRHDYYSLRFMGFRVNDPESGAVVGQFPHLFPAAIAIGYGLDGLTGARRTVGVWAILGVLALYFAGQRFVGRTAAFTAAALLSLHVIQVWFARYPNAEVVMQALLFAALLAHARAHVDGNRFFAPIAGVLLGLLLFLRFDAVLGIAAVLGAVALLVLARRLRPDPWFLAGLGLTIAAGTAYLLGPMRAYVDLPIVFLSHLGWWQYAAMAGAVVVLCAALVAGARAPAVGAWVSTWAPTLLTAALVTAAAYSFWLRAPIDGVLAARDAYSLRTFSSFYLTLPALLAAVLGFALFAHRAFWRAPELFTTVSVYAFFFFYKVRIFSDHFWMARRFLPVILPGALLFAAAAALGGSRGTWAPTRLVRQAIGVAFVAVLAMQYNRAAAPVLAHVEYAGIIPRLEAIAKQVGDRDLLIVESRNASDSHVLAVPLAYIYDRHVLMLNSPRPDKAVMAAYLDWARTRYERVLFLGGGGTDLLSPSWSARAVASERFAVPEYDAPVDAYPRFARGKEFDYTLYSLLPPDPADATRPFDLDVGVSDDLHVLRFHAKESSEGRSFRWSRDRSLIAITGLTAASREVELSLNDGGRPAAVPPADVTISLAGEPLGIVRVTTGFKDYVVAIPASLAERLAAAGGTAEMRLTTSVWRPETVIGSGDDRELGVMVDRVKVR